MNPDCGRFARFMDLGAEGLPQVVNLNTAGYPGDKQFGEMWYDYCTNITLPFDSERSTIVFHSCRTFPGSSGSAMWTYTQGDETHNATRQVALINTSITTAFKFTDGDIMVSVDPAGTFLYGVLLQELQRIMAEMQCAS